MAKMNDFLLQYFMQWRFNNMPPEVRAKFMDFARGNNGKGDFRGNMSMWKKRLLNPDLTEKSLPDPNHMGAEYHLDDDEWEKLFKAFQDAFRSMAAQQDSFKDNEPAKNFLAGNFGAGKLFTYAVANAGAEFQIQNLIKAFNDHPQLAQVLKQANIVGGDFSFSKFTSGLATKKYNNDPAFNDQLLQIVGGLEWLAQSDRNVAPMLAGIDFSAITNGFDSSVDPARLANFKRMHRTLMDPLITEDKIFNIFKNHDSGKITGQIELAKQNVAYDDKNSPDYVPPKRTDELTPWQQLKDDAGNTYNAVLGKYLSKHGNRMYFSDAAKHIVGAIDGAKISPTDGIAKVLEKASKITSNLQYKSPTATKHFEWFNKTLTELKDTMPKAFAGALKNGRQMNALISELIMKAVRENKIDEAKTAMEVLSVIKYGYTTSKIMDALGKEELSIFSAPGLSWNKNEGMKFVSAAMDKSIKAAFMGIGYGITIAENMYNLSGSKFNGDRGRMAQAQQKWDAANTQAKADKQNDVNMRNQADQNEIRTQNNNKAQLNQNLQPGQQIITDANLQTLKNALNNNRATEQQQKQRLDQTAQSAQYQTAKSIVDQYNELNARLPQLTSDLQQKTQELNQIRADLANLGAAPMSDAERNARAIQLVQRQQELNNAIQQLQIDEQTARTTMNAITANPNWAQYQTAVADYARDEQNYNDLHTRNENEDSRITQWESATSSIQELNTQIAKRNQEMSTWDGDHKDQYKELMAYWDMLETGRNTHTGKMYKWDLLQKTKDSQKAFDTNKDGIIANYMNNYSYTA